jgi:hypothetical protein
MGGCEHGKPSTCHFGASDTTDFNVSTNIESITPTPLVNNAIFNTGTTGHYLLLKSKCANKHPLQIQSVMLPNGDRIESSHDADLLFKDLP